MQLERYTVELEPVGDERQSRHEARFLKRARPTRRRGGSAITPKPGGIRQRRNKRWAW